MGAFIAIANFVVGVACFAKAIEAMEMRFYGYAVIGFLLGGLNAGCFLTFGLPLLSKVLS